VWGGGVRRIRVCQSLRTCWAGAAAGGCAGGLACADTEETNVTMVAKEPMVIANPSAKIRAHNARRDKRLVSMMTAPSHNHQGVAAAHAQASIERSTNRQLACLEKRSTYVRAGAS